MILKQENLKKLLDSIFKGEIEPFCLSVERFHFHQITQNEENVFCPFESEKEVQQYLDSEGSVFCTIFKDIDEDTELEIIDSVMGDKFILHCGFEEEEIEDYISKKGFSKKDFINIINIDEIKIDIGNFSYLGLIVKKLSDNNYNISFGQIRVLEPDEFKVIKLKSLDKFTESINNFLKKFE